MKFLRSRMLSRWGIPSTNKLNRHLNQLAESDDAAKRAVGALRSGVFADPKGNRDSLGGVKVSLDQAALLSWLAGRCATTLSVEVGFGMGMTAAIILASRVRSGHEFEHIIFDPYGLPDGAGKVVEEFLAKQFGVKFRRVRKKSQFGIAELDSNDPAMSSRLIHIDGDHRFDFVFADFFMADQLLEVGGFIVVDDAAFPAIETLVQFVIHNRSDYEVSNLEIPNTAVLRKVACDKRNWDHFRPFPVPQRQDWTATQAAL